MKLLHLWVWKQQKHKPIIPAFVACWIIFKKNIMKRLFNKLYFLVLQPQNIRNQFETESDFVNWLKEGSKKDLKFTLIAFAKAEMYTDCKLIINEIELLK
jgi:hypothetical protein